MNNQIVILGAGFAGMMAALRLSRKLPKDATTITLVNDSDMFVERTRLHQFATGQHPKTRAIASLLRGTGVQFLQGRATAIQPDKRQLSVETMPGTQSMNYDYLVYALGSRTDRERILGLEHAYTLDAADVAKLKDELPKVATRRGRVLIIGGGLTSIEAATEIAETYPSAQVTLATRGGFGDDLSKEGAAHLRQVFERLHIHIRDHATISRIEPNVAITNTGEQISFDVCVNCAGFVVPALAREAGLVVNGAGQIIIDALMRSVEHPEIYGAGDAAAFEDEAHMPLRMACNTAMPMAICAADNLVAHLTSSTPHPFAFGFGGRCISLGRREGLVQMVDARDVPQPRVVTGMAAVVFKEGILRYVTSSLDAEKRFSLFRAPRTIVACIAHDVIQPVPVRVV